MNDDFMNHYVDPENEVKQKDATEKLLAYPMMEDKFQNYQREFHNYLLAMLLLVQFIIFTEEMLQSLS